MNDGLEQRWRAGRDAWARHAKIDPARYNIEECAWGEAKAFVVQHHYSGTVPAAILPVGIYYKPTATSWLLDSRLVGVAVFSVPMTDSVITSRTGLPAREGAELGRFVLIDGDEAPWGLEVMALARAFAELRRAKPHIRAVVAYSDPVPRTTTQGTIKPGHVGTIYQAHNAIYMGRGSRRTLRLLPDGRVLTDRTRQKLIRGEKGHEYASEQLAAQTGLRRRQGETGESYLARVEASGAIRYIPHPGNHCYTWALTKDARASVARVAGVAAQDGMGASTMYSAARELRPYPKTPDGIMEP